MTIPKLESGELHRYKLTEEKQFEQYSIPKREVGKCGGGKSGQIAKRLTTSPSLHSDTDKGHQ